jgi:hypothetical protein
VAFDDENQARIRATLNGRPAIDWQGPITDFASPGFDWPRISVGYLGLGAGKATRFHRVAFRELGDTRLLSNDLALEVPRAWDGLPPEEPAEAIVAEAPANPSTSPPVEMPADPPAEPYLDPPAEEPELTETDRRVAAIIEAGTGQFKEEAAQAFNQAVANLNAKYLTALKRDETNAAQEGLLDDLLAIKSEIESLTSIGTDPTPLPPELPGNATDLLKSRRDTYTQQIDQFTATRLAAEAPALQAIDAELETLETELTRAQNYDEAIKVRATRDKLKTSGLPSS